MWRRLGTCAWIYHSLAPPRPSRGREPTRHGRARAHLLKRPPHLSPQLTVSEEMEGETTSNGCDATPGVRAAVTALPEQLLSPPYEMRTEMNWIDFSGTANPLGTPPSFIRAMEAALAAGEPNYSPDREAHTLRSVLARQHGLPVESFLVGSHRGRHGARRRADLPALHRGRGRAGPGGVRAGGRQRRAPRGGDRRAPPASSCPTPPRPRATACPSTPRCWRTPS